MRIKVVWFVLLVLCGCAGTTPLEPPVYTLTVWFEDVPDSYYSRPIGEYLAIQAHATMEPGGQIDWCLDVLRDAGWEADTCGTSQPGERAGQRWYLERGGTWHLRFRAWSSVHELSDTILGGPEDG